MVFEVKGKTDKYIVLQKDGHGVEFLGKGEKYSLFFSFCNLDAAFTSLEKWQFSMIIIFLLVPHLWNDDSR